MNKADELLMGVPADLADNPWVKDAIEELRLLSAARDGFAEDERLKLVDLARSVHCEGSDNTIEVDDNTRFSVGNDGAWIQGWLWLTADQCASVGVPLYVDEDFAGEGDDAHG